MIRSGLVLLAAAATLSFGQRAAAAPYKVYAKYHLKSDTSKTIQVPLDPDVPLVRGASGVAFDGIYIQLDEQSKAELGSLRNFTVDFTCTDPDCKGTREMLSLDAASLKADNYAEKLVLPPAMFNGESAVQMVVLNVHAKPSAEALCTAELAQRMAKGSTLLPFLPKTLATGKSASATRDDVIKVQGVLKGNDDVSDELAYSLLIEKGLKQDGQPIVYSFCKGLKSAIDYTKLAGWLRPTDKGATAATEEAAQHHLLGSWLLSTIKGISSVGPLQSSVEKPGLPENVFAVATHPFTVLRAPEFEFNIRESDEGGEPFKHGIVEQTSTVVLTGEHSKLCRQTLCDRLIEDRLAAYVDYVENSASTTAASSSPTGGAGSVSSTTSQHLLVKLRSLGHRWAFDTDLRKLLNKEVTFRIAYKIGDQEFDLLSSGPVTVRNLGVVQSFPVVSEVAALIMKSPKTLDDVEVQSSIPLSYAVNLQGGPSRAAITFPWMIGVNTRALPNLADYIRIFPHVSLVFPGTSAADKTQVAFGGGVALAQAFTFSAASTVGDTPAPYFMIGISAPDLVKVLK